MKNAEDRLCLQSIKSSNKKRDYATNIVSFLHLDANRFAKSGGRLDDDSIMTTVSISRYPYRELSQAQDLAARIAAESASLVRPEVLIYLVEHGFLVK